MKVKHLDLQNIRSFTNLKIDFSPSINLLVGHNNSGKSTIIKSLYKLHNSHSLSESDVRKLKKHGRIHIHLDEINYSEQVAIKECVDKEKMNDLFFDSIKYTFSLYDNRYERKNKFESLLYESQFIPIEDENGKPKMSSSDGSECIFYEFKGLPNYENKFNFIYPVFAKRKTNHYNSRVNEKEAYHVSEDLGNITAKVSRLSNNSHPKNKMFVELNQSILGFNVGVLPFREEQTTGVFITDSESIPIQSMGEGVVNILGLIVSLLTEDRKLYLIEELENDIHPKALKQLLELRVEKSKLNQFVISTHSNIVLKHLGIEGSKIFKLEWTPFEKDILDRLPTTKLIEIEDSPIEKISLLEYLGYELYDFDLYFSYLIFEESSAETLVREFIIPTFFPQLKGRIKTIASSGVDDIEARLSDFLRLFVYIHTTPIYKSRAWIIADGDTAGKNVIGKLVDKFPAWDKSHFYNLTNTNIEDYYPLRFTDQVAKALNESDKSKKKELKKLLLLDVLNWCTENVEDAKKEFSESANEIIE